MRALQKGLAGIARDVPVRVLRRRERDKSFRRYPHVPVCFLRELNGLWRELFFEVDYQRASRVWAKAYTRAVRKGEDALRWGMDVVGCIQRLYELRGAGAEWLRLMTPETVIKCLGRYRARAFEDVTARALERYL